MNLTIAGQLIVIDINDAATIAFGVFVGMVTFTIFSNIVYAIRTSVLSNQYSIPAPPTRVGYMYSDDGTQTQIPVNDSFDHATVERSIWRMFTPKK